MMKILSEKDTGLGGKYCLVAYEDGKFAFGTRSEIYSSDIKNTIPVNQYGSKDEILMRCNSLIKLHKDEINKCHR